MNEEVLGQVEDHGQQPVKRSGLHRLRRRERKRNRSGRPCRGVDLDTLLRRTVDAVMGASEHVVHPSHRKDLDRRDVLGLREARDQVLAGLNERVATL